MTMTMISEPEENNNSNSSFTLQELKALAEVDSRLFGFLKLNLPENTKKKALIVRAVRSLEKVLINHEKKKSATSGTKQSKSVEKSPAGASADIQSEDTSQLPSVGNEPKELNIKIYCKLGHFHLLLEDYGKALSAYQIYYTLEDNHWMVLVTIPAKGHIRVAGDHGSVCGDQHFVFTEHSKHAQ